LTGLEDTINFRGSAGTGTEARLTLNARVEMEPETLEQIVHEILNRTTQENIDAKILAWKCLSPGRPAPTYRYEYVVPIF
jgi:hypothetical protein